ncbi:glycosyltransferase family 2 protein [Roseburia sp. 499]|uniref:glycosyltransferase family 2 protein n=1 Tax=Roseburia sp. 499 TaxID=1261634 RepID=UPI0009531D4D|nr:glycosyltransferase family 2 protein [Roseburia sp. 499]WVK69262.1 glycosyltransferase family 2 protein [Roseburia sp. 499]
MIDISITIVAYNDEEDVRNAVCSIMEHTAATIKKKIYIVDNSTEKNALDSFATQWEEVGYRKPEQNLGFGAGHNYVLSELDSKYHAIVNPDIILKEDSLQTLMKFMEQNQVGMAVPRMTDEKGEFQAVYRRELTVLDMGIRMFLSSHFKKRQAYHTMQDMDYSKTFQVPFAQGSFLVIQTELFQKLGGFDTRYFMYMEDADLCKQVNQCSSLYYCPDTTVIHKWERASKKNGKLRRIHIASMFRYFCKWGWKLW